MAEEEDQGGGGGEDPRVEMLQQYCLKTMKQVNCDGLGYVIIYAVQWGVAFKYVSAYMPRNSTDRITNLMIYKGVANDIIYHGAADVNYNSCSYGDRASQN